MLCPNPLHFQPRIGGPRVGVEYLKIWVNYPNDTNHERVFTNSASSFFGLKMDGDSLTHLQKVEAPFVEWIIRQRPDGQHWPLKKTALESHHGLARAHASCPTGVFIYKPKFAILYLRPTITNAASSCGCK